MITTTESESMAFTSSSSWRPDIPPMTMSVSTIGNGFARKAANASSALATAVTR